MYMIVIFGGFFTARTREKKESQASMLMLPRSIKDSKPVRQFYIQFHNDTFFR
jgi:hypothetical protein